MKTNQPSKNDSNERTPVSREAMEAILKDIEHVEYGHDLDRGTSLTLQVVNTHRIHAFWSVDAGMLKAISSDGRHSHPDLILRLYETDFVDGNRQAETPFFDVAVQGLENNWYISLWKDGITLKGRLGVLDDDGLFTTLAESSEIKTPRAENRSFRDWGQQLIRELTNQDPGADDDNKVSQWDPEPVSGSSPTPTSAHTEWADDLVIELLLKGRVAMGYGLYIHGRRIRAKPDGSFVMRRSIQVSSLKHVLLAASAKLDFETTALQLDDAAERTVFEIFSELHIRGSAHQQMLEQLLDEPIYRDAYGEFHVVRGLPEGAVILPELRLFKADG